MKGTERLAYLASVDSFLDHRLRYFSDSNTIPISEVQDKIYPDSFKQTEAGIKSLEQRVNAIERLRGSKAPITIVTATKDRPDSLSEAYQLLASQEGSIDWNWLIIDNLGDQKTKEVISGFNDERVVHAVYTEQTGSAYPVRNFGFDLIHYANFRRIDVSGYVMVIDSDDRLYGQNSLRELFKIAKARIAKSKGLYIAHGFADSEIYETGKEVLHVPNPRDLDSKFPEVEALKEVLDKGLNVLSGMFPIELLSWLRYPPEISFEDDGFNQKLMLQAKRQGYIWLAEKYPVTVKRFHQDSMAGVNNQRGDTSLTGRVGEHIVTGMRAEIVTYLHKLTDYYTRENL